MFGATAFNGVGTLQDAIATQSVQDHIRYLNKANLMCLNLEGIAGL